MDVSRKQSTSNFPKKELFLPPQTYTYVCVSGGKKCSFFGQFGELCNIRFEIRPFASLPTTYYQGLFVMSEIFYFRFVFSYNQIRYQ